MGTMWTGLCRGGRGWLGLKTPSCVKLYFVGWLGRLKKCGRRQEREAKGASLLGSVGGGPEVGARGEDDQGDGGG
jgi:hypothetical protein